MPRRIVLDTDIGTDVDDALALALALASPELELVAITTVSGDTSLRARIAARLLALAGRADVPVHAGCEQPLAAGGGFAQGGHEGEGILDGGPDDFSAQPAVMRSCGSSARATGSSWSPSARSPTSPWRSSAIRAWPAALHVSP